MGGFFFGALIAAVVMVLLCNAGEFSPFMAKLHALEQVIVTALISLVIVDAKPLAYKTVWRERRCRFVLDEDLSATIRGRTFGIPRWRDHRHSDSELRNELISRHPGKRHSITPEFAVVIQYTTGAPGHL